jgi:hypothetical protein
MGNDGVLTSKDYFNQQKIESGEIKSPDINKNNRIKYRYRLKSAPLGKSQTTVIFQGKPMDITMEDGIFILPDNWGKKNEKEKFHLFIQNLGFEDACEIEGIIKKDEDDNKSKKVYKIGHPDNTKDSKVEGNVSITIDGKDIQFECKEGVIITEDEKVFKAFKKKGWYEISVTKK